MGYKTYRILPQSEDKCFSTHLARCETILENRFYKIILDSESGAVVSIYDKDLAQEIVDAAAPHGFNQLLARWPETGEEGASTVGEIREGEDGPIYASLLISARGAGCPEITQEILLYNDIKRIDFRNRILRDSTPLLELYFPFPFLVENPQFRFEAAGSVIEPLVDQLPGTNTDYYTMQHWANIYNEDMGIAFSSIQAPVVEFGGLWPGFVSMNHHCVTPPGYEHEFKKPGDFDRGYVYSYVMNNNFITNFNNVQVSDSLYCYSLTTHEGDWLAGNANRFGWSIGNPLTPVCIQGDNGGTLKTNMSFCQVDKDNVVLLTMKEAEDREGLIIRLAETQGQDSDVEVTLPFIEIRQGFQTNLVEENEATVATEKHSVVVHVKAFGITTIRIQS